MILTDDSRELVGNFFEKDYKIFEFRKLRCGIAGAGGSTGHSLEPK
jgi:hypothetical protein